MSFETYICLLVSMIFNWHLNTNNQETLVDRLYHWSDERRGGSDFHSQQLNMQTFPPFYLYFVSVMVWKCIRSSYLVEWFYLQIQHFSNSIGKSVLIKFLNYTKSPIPNLKATLAVDWIFRTDSAFKSRIVGLSLHWYRRSTGDRQ